MKQRTYYRPLYGPWSTSDVLGLLDERLMHCRSRNHYRFTLNPSVLGIDIEDAIRILRHWCREWGIAKNTTVRLGMDGDIRVYLPIPRSSFALAQVDYAERITHVAKAIQTEYSYIERQPRWDDLHQDAKAAWCQVARAAINAYNEAQVIVLMDGIATIAIVLMMVLAAKLLP